MTRTAQLKRTTSETDIRITLDVDGRGIGSIDTGIGFLDHMLTLFTKHGCFDLEVSCLGDLEVDTHHTIEDVGIVLGQAFKQAVGDLKGVKRYATKFIPMDEALAAVSVDFSGRPYLVYDAAGSELTELYEEFFRAFAFQAGITLHIRLLYGKNAHHIVEAIFKATARAVREALEQDERVEGVPSTKGLLTWES